ncbi:unnamed protein product [Bursaphelenchus xylophilus]|uniref:(pine wood nematode) hypothetical protein n=1 Tax=Bursaphelenchus xylophilus TaxID=6326 RepID=A0A1I7RH47_BURXY|nr:unnamed protein product [Bursaphelenchus xylophilus]CAG9115979.1 unnamed protein product [Bursaphelenchus xylophilus]
MFIMLTVSTENESSNLRKILYPTYSREPYELEKWSFYSGMDVPQKGSGYGLWAPISRYSDLFDRNLRSVKYVVDGKLDGEVSQVESGPQFVPFYSGRGR